MDKEWRQWRGEKLKSVVCRNEGILVPLSLSRSAYLWARVQVQVHLLLKSSAFLTTCCGWAVCVLSRAGTPLPRFVCRSMVSVQAHQGSVLNPLVFIVVLEFHTGVPWELLYADDLVVIADTQEECISKFNAWKAGMESKGLHVNIRRHSFLSLVLALMSSRNPASTSVLYGTVVSTTPPLDVCSASCGSSWGASTSLINRCITQTTSAPGILARVGSSAADQWLK